MAFVITQSAGYFWPVEVSVPIDGGRYEKATFEVEFKRLPQPEIEKLITQIAAGDTTDLSVCNTIITGWKGVSDGQGELVFSPSTLEQLLQIPTVAMSIIKAWMESLSGAARKN